MKVIAVILAGGQSRRMGRDKAELSLGGETFLSRLVREYRRGFPVYVSVGQRGRFDTCGAGELVDIHPGMGPLAGLEAAFAYSDAEAVFLTATDLPFGTLELAESLLERLGDADACVIRRSDGNSEPAFGIYRRSCQDMVQMLLAENRRAFRTLLERVTVRWVEEAELAGFSLPRLLQNVNTPEAYQRAVREEAEQRTGDRERL